MDRVILFCDHTIGFRMAGDFLQYKGIQILGIYTNRKTGVEWWPDVHDLTSKEIEILDYDSTTSRHLISVEFDYLLLFSWRHILDSDLVKAAKKGCVNLHYSLLPLHRGVYPINWSIICGDEYTGVTFHFVNKSIDEGDIIAQRKINIEKNDTVNSLLTKLDDLAFNLFEEIWPERDVWPDIKIKQNISLSSYHSKKDFDKIGRLKFDETYTVRDFVNLIRGKSFNGSSLFEYDMYGHSRSKMKISIKIGDDE